MPVSIVGASAEESDDACAAIRAATALLAREGVPLPAALFLHVADALPSSAPRGALACYRPAANTIDVLTQAAFAERGPIHGRQADRALWRAVIAHEVAHAALACAMPAPGPSMRAGEYLAGVVMVETMAPDLREALLAAMPGPGFETELEISSLAFLMDPTGFALKAWRHWRSAGNGSAFVRAILEGRALAGAEP